MLQKIVLTSESEIKKEVVENVFSPYMYEINQIKSNSGVPEQPMGFSQIEKGALNRIKKISLESECDNIIYISIENGIVVIKSDVIIGSDFITGRANDIIEISEKYYDVACVVLSFNGIKTTSWSSMIPLNKKYVEEIPKDQSKTYSEIIYEKKLSTNDKDPHKSICGVSRKNILIQALEIVKGVFEKNN